MAGNCRYKTNNIKGVKVLKIVGDFNKTTTPRLQKVCGMISRQRDTKAILLDLKGVTDIDTTAFACVVNFIKEHMGEGIGIGAINLNTKENRLLEILRINNFIQIFKKKSRAIAVLSGKK